MKKIYLFLLSALVSISVFSQNPNLSFDGVDDYIDLGTNAGSGIRTLECWFKLDNEINSTLSEYSSIVVRNTSNEFEELFLAFFPIGPAPGVPGHLVFGVTLQSNVNRIVYSNSNQWNANQWYHVAGVIHPVNGMSLYIDGIKQVSTESNTSPSEASTFITTVGSWGTVSNGRNFDGNIDDLRFSSDAMYTANFTPPCPDLLANTSTIGLWNFNENSGTIVEDSSSNNYDGQIFGAVWSSSVICNSVGIKNLDIESHLVNIFPNPSEGIFDFQILKPVVQDLKIEVYNSIGQLVISEKARSNDFSINIKNQDNGVYFYKITESKMNAQSGILTKW